MGRKVLVLAAILVFLTGLGILLYPDLHGAVTHRQIQETAHAFLEQKERNLHQPEGTASTRSEDMAVRLIQTCLPPC